MSTSLGPNGPKPIKFGTSGWRDIFGDGFTFANVRLATQAIADHLKERDAVGAGVVVASDYRYMAERLVDEAAAVLLANGVPVLRAGFSPTPAVSWAILEHEAGGAINFTASHNPPEYNGLKYNPAWGGPALPEDTQDITRRANADGASHRIQRIPLGEVAGHAHLTDIDSAPSYLAQLEKLVDFDALRTLRVGVDPMFGAGRGFLDRILKEQKVEASVLHDSRDVLFGGSSPDPSPAKLEELSSLVTSNGLHMGIATDGDADRFGVVDDDGTFILPNYILALVFDYVVRERGFEGGAARSVSTTHLMDLVGKHYDRPVEEHPVGFKYIGKAIAEDRIAMGGEESGGLSVRSHVPEKDGVLACLLACEIRARRGKPFKQLIEELWGRVGKLVSTRVNVPFDPEKRASVEGKLTQAPAEFAGMKVERTDTRDGLKLYLQDGTWFLVRISGTEPVIRLYAEAQDDSRVTRLIDDGRKFLLADA